MTFQLRLLIVGILFTSQIILAQEAADWPRDVEGDGQTVTIYQPQVESWKDNKLQERAAVSVKTPGSEQPAFGVIWMSARTETDLENHMVTLEDLEITKASFPSAPDKAESYTTFLKEKAPEILKPISLDRLQASLALTRAESKGEGQALKNDPPQIFYSSTPATLVLVDGTPALRGTEEKNLMRVINTRALILFNKENGKYFLFLANKWHEASSITGPWVKADLDAGSKSAMNNVKKEMNDEKIVDLLSDEKTPNVSKIYVSTGPAELLQTEGKAALEPVADTNLLYVKNTTDNVFLNTNDQNYYVSLSGRWFRSKSLDGHWDFVKSSDLPQDFSKIPENHPKGDVLASVAGTPQAKEALVNSQIPQTATVERSQAHLAVTYDGAPEFVAIDGTQLQYASNASLAVIQYRPHAFYAVQNGVWFTAPNPTGAWVVATEVPSAIYGIPARSPLHYVTYVYVYGSSPQVVYVGYLPGYYGSYISSDGVVVYGTGYYYRPWIGAHWYGYPWTFGFGVAWNPGWGWGFHGGPFYHPWWGPWRGYNWGAYHPGGVFIGASINRANFYNNWSHSAVRPVRYQAPHPMMSARAASPQRNNVYTDHKGNIFRHDENKGWEKYDSHAWKAHSAAAPAEVEHERVARAQGEKRASQYRKAGVQHHGR